MSRIIIKSPAEIELLKTACQVTKDILDQMNDFVRPGISTEDINIFVHELTIKAGARPAPLNYRGYPKSVCTSVNEVVCHGIPNPNIILQAGDIINIDVTSIKNGFYGDSSRMYFVGGREACSAEAVRLVDITKEALMVGINAVEVGKQVGDIGYEIKKFIHHLPQQYGIVRDYTGHGIGRNFHEDPQIIHSAKQSTGAKFKVGMTFTVEPMINLGTADTVLSSQDGWTVRTADNKLSAQWEHTVAITENGIEILTA